MRVKVDQVGTMNKLILEIVPFDWNLSILGMINLGLKW